MYTLGGFLYIKITSASVSDAISKISKKGVVLYGIEVLDEFSFQCEIRRADYLLICELTNKYNWQTEKINKSGFYWSLIQIIKRPVLLVGVAMLLLFALLLPTKVLFVFVEGNKTVSTNQIVDVSKNCGLFFGASRAEVRNEKIKNELLDKIPQLEWAGVNTYGCVANITVRERAQTNGAENREMVSHIISTQDGIITKMDVKSGEPIFAVGQAVKIGEKLVSGYTDCGIKIRAERSVAEVFAITTRSLTVISPVPSSKKTAHNEQNTNYSLIIGKKLINLSQGSGIYDAVCDKMYKKYTLTLPGGFELPVSLLYTYVESDTDSQSVSAISEDGMKNAAVEYLNTQMVAGEIRNSAISMEHTQDLLILRGTYFCTEMIGKEQYEERYDSHE